MTYFQSGVIISRMLGSTGTILPYQKITPVPSTLNYLPVSIRVYFLSLDEEKNLRYFLKTI